MSSFGSQWRIIRHYLSMSNLHTEVEKLVQKMKPAPPEQWDNLIRKFEKAVTVRLSTTVKEIETSVDKKTKTAQVTVEPTVEKEKEKPPSQDKNQEVLTVGSEAKEMTIEGLWQGLKLKKDTHFGKISENSWKSNKPIVTKTSIHSRTAYVISALVTAETTECLMSRTEHFIDHLKQYPESRDYAIKEGAVRALLRVQRRLNSNEPAVQEAAATVKEALALMGYTGPTKGPGPAILSIDGGGIRGLIAIEVLRHLERLTGRRVQDMFDYIIGVSTGAIIAAVIGGGVGTLETANQMYMTLSKEMFGNTSLIGGASRLVWTHSYYDTDAWEKLLQKNLGDCTLTECNRRDTPKMALVSCVVNTGSKLSPYLFRSYESPFRVRSVFPGTARARLWHAVRASAAAPTYFNEFRLDNLLHQDGGIMVNNPTGIGIHEAKLLFGANALKNGTVISVGTGKALNKHLDYQLLSKGLQKEAPGTSWKDKFNKILDSATDTEGCKLSPFQISSKSVQRFQREEVTNIHTNNVLSVGTGKALNKHLDYQLLSKGLQKEAPGTSWKDKFNKILDSATDTEGTHLILNDLLPPGSYFRFNPPLMAECAMDEIDPKKLNNLVTDTQAYIRRNQHKFEQAAAMLVRKRSLAQKVMDFVEYQGQIMGVQSK